VLAAEHHSRVVRDDEQIESSNHSIHALVVLDSDIMIPCSCSFDDHCFSMLQVASRTLYPHMLLRPCCLCSL
jgi:hypothetical protein